MKTISGFPYSELQFTKEAALFDTNELTALQEMITNGSVTDLFVISHGWNNDMQEARGLYDGLAQQIASAKAAAGDSKMYGILGVLWPSKKFADKELIAGNAASIDGPSDDADRIELRKALDNLEGFFDGSESDEIISKAKKLAAAMGNDSGAGAIFVKEMNKLFKEGVHSADGAPDEDLIHSFEDSSPADLLIRLQEDDFDNPDSTAGTQSGGSTGAVFASEAAGMAASMKRAGGAETGGSAWPAGGAAGAGLSLGNIFGAAKNLLNFVTYYQMKERAGRVGVNGLHPVLISLKTQFPLLRLHLIGHSFGGRLVTATVAGPAGSTLQVDSLILLQAAFSHFGFSNDYGGGKEGFFRSVISDKKVKGVIMITYTHNDTAVGIAYAIASRIARQVGSFNVGSNLDIYGGMGGNGAVQTPEAKSSLHLAKEVTYDFVKGNLYNVNGDDCIMNHSDICKIEVGRAVVAAVNA